ncbi:hypothetical protein B0T26DRAFT_735607 [Lasiosphaeria miniovina]|uniref:Sister chromatid cohesion protein DCC1 n=1 Tax=Lasiosphaeria miniovina TaxID=1954250 RepID=A0AA40DJB9_9PEZI|nr:uncharacterized protein B0T26DRAFT_735607 [Lasiosphaeria miniovina]KAK0702033.1 hypothetical protein B0T26DRAFT_735607 [Lasiosphaeria miniovina]
MPGEGQTVSAAAGGLGISLSYAPDGVGYKLLELPAELAELLERGDAPVLTLTSSPAAALLKTADKTYSLRQKNTSNALILLAPVQQQQTAEGEDGSPAMGLHAIATVHETIELVPGTGEAAPAPVVRGKWHEKFGRTR